MSAAAAPPGPAIEPKDGPAAPSFPAGATTSVSSVERACHRHRLGAVGERRIGLADTDERDPGSVVGVAVAVRVDGTVEARDQLVAARVDDVAAGGVRLPAGDPDREHGRSGSDAVEPVRAARTDEQARELRPVLLPAPRVLRARLGVRLPAGSRMSIPAATRPRR